MTLGTARRAPSGAADPGLSGGAFVALMAALMATNALSIDSMLTALPAIAGSLHLTDANERQWIISAYVISFGASQIIWGPLADRFGRRPVLLTGLLCFTLCSFVAALAKTFTLLIVVRVLQGITASTSRVLVASIVRDCYQGRQMARVISLSFTVFLMVPILAPSIGHLILISTGTWRAIFHCLAGFGALVLVVVALRLRETLHPEYRRRISPAGIGGAVLLVLRTRSAIGYTLGGMLSYASMVGLITSIQQIFGDRFHALDVFPIAFAGMAGAMGVASFLNARIVGRLGARRVSHAALVGFVASAVLHLGVAHAGYDRMPVFIAIQAATMFCVALLGANFNAMAMEEMGAIAGTASSVQGTISTGLGAVIGAAIGQSYDGTTVPLFACFTLAGFAMLAIVLWTERGRLFRPHHPDPLPAQ